MKQEYSKYTTTEPISADPCRQQGGASEKRDKRWRKRWTKKTNNRKSKKLEARRSKQVAQRKPVAEARNYSKQDAEARGKILVSLDSNVR